MKKLLLLILVSSASLIHVSVALKDAESNQTGTITQFLKSQFALANKMQQQPSESGNVDALNFDGKYKLLLSGDLASELDVLNDSSEIDEPTEHDIFSSDDDDFYKLQFPEKETTSKTPKESFKENIYKVPKTRNIKKFNMLKENNNFSVNSFEQFTRLFDHFEWNLNNLNSSEISKMCVEDVQLYLNELRNSKEWAIRAVDASGRFRGLFFSENDFWLGSKDLCDEVNNINFGNRKIPRLEFFVMKILIKFDFMKNQRLLQVSQCLPDTCKPREIIALMNLDAASINFRQKNELTIFESRKVPGDFNILQSTKFYIFCFIISIVIFLIVVATIFEYKLRIRGFQLETSQQCNKDRQKHELDYINNNNNNNIDTECTSMNENKPLKELNQMEKILLCFSLETNVKTILNCDNESKDSLSCIHGLRFIAILWTILVHTYLQVFGIGENKFNRVRAERTFIYQLVGNATFSVDTFFFISGFLVVYLYLKSEKSITNKEITLTNSIMKILQLIFYRFIRLTPVYLVVIVFTELSLKHVYNESVFAPGLSDHLTCENYWWRNIFYINNFYPLTETCLMWSWYLANDFQFYIVSVVLLIFTSRRLKITIFVKTFLLVIALIISMFISVRHKYQHKVAEPFESFDFLYNKPWQRFGPYVMGTFTAFIYHFNKSPKRISTNVNVSLWIISCLGLFFIVFGVPNGKLSVIATSFYVSFGHALWGLCLMWILLSCCWGIAHPINKLLSFKALMPLSRLTYCAYLIHPTIMMITSYNSETPFPLKHGMITTTFLGNAVFSFLGAFVLSLMFEAPVIRILKVIFKK